MARSVRVSPVGLPQHIVQRGLKRLWKMPVNTTLVLICLVLLGPSIASAGVYVGFSPSLIEIDTPAATTRPLAAGIRLGYAASRHLIELAIMGGVKDDSLNQLTVELPSAQSVFYRYSLIKQSRIKVHFILGASHIEVKSSYQGADTTDSFTGVSYGIGFEEALKSIPQLKLTFDWIQLYHGEQLDINATSFGIRYEF